MLVMNQSSSSVLNRLLLCLCKLIRTIVAQTSSITLAVLMLFCAPQALLAQETTGGETPIESTETESSGTSSEVGECTINDEEGRTCTDPEPGQIPQGNLPTLLGGNPINILSGNKHQKERDFELPASQLTFQRTYNSISADNNIGIGQGWHHTYAVSLYSAGDEQMEIVQSNGSRLRFSADGTYEADQPIMRGDVHNAGYVVRRGRYHEWNLPDGRTLRFRGSYLVRIDWPDQQHLDLFYKGGRVAEITDETGRVMRFDYYAGRSVLSGYEENRFGEAAGHLSSVTLPDGSKIDYAYDQNRNLTRASFADGTHRDYHYENPNYPNHLTGITDRTGVRFSTWEYDDNGRAISSEHANAVQRMSIEYPDLRQVMSGQSVDTRITNALGQQSTYTWRQESVQSRPQLLSSEGVACITCPPTGFSYAYDEQGRLLSRTRNGQGTAVGVGNTRYVYDAQGRMSEIWHSDEFAQERLSERLEYDGQSLLPARRYTPSINPDALQVTETERNAQGLRVQMVERGFAPEVNASGVITGFTPIERTTRLAYDEGRLVSLDGPREDVDDVTRFVWDTQNRLTTIAMPDSPALRISEFDALGRAITFERGAQGQSASPISVTYNAASQFTSVTQTGRTLSLQYDEEGRLSEVINRVGRKMQLQYDEAGQLISIESVGGHRYTQEYDEEGRVIGESLMDQYGEMIRSLSKLYDAQGRVASVSREVSVAGVVGADSTYVDYEYDVHNRMVRATDRLAANSVEFEYDTFGELAGITAPSTDTGIKLGYDITGKPTSVSDARDNTTQFIKDDFGRAVAVLSADAGVSRYGYDAAGNRIRWTNPAGNTTQYTWDAANRPLLIESRDGETRFSYDRRTGQLAQTSNPSTTERFEYDRDSRLLRHERVIDERSFVTEYGYDNQGRMTSRQLPDGQSLRYHYYEDGKMAGRLRAITRSSLFGLQQDVLLAEIDEDSSDGITGFIGHNGKRTTRTHASDGRVTRIEVSDSLTLGYRYDGQGRIVGIDENGIAQSFTYSRGRLSSADTLTGSFVFNYDQAGNRTAQSRIGPDGQYSQKEYQFAQAGNGNRLLAQDDLTTQSTSAVSYNDSGSPVSRGNLRYEYNNDQRPVRVYKDGALLAEYAYNSFGERIKKVTYRGDQKRITYFLYDGHQLSAEIVADDESSNASMAQTLYLQELPVIQLIGKEAYAVHTDRLGTAQLLTNAEGAIAWQAEYSPFGKATVLVEDVVFKLRLPGQYEDSETGTHYNYLRDYDPETGRYLTSDPISINGGLNTYQYANADPLNSVDVLGLKPDLSFLNTPDEPGTHIDGEDFDQLHGFAMAGDGSQFFALLWNLTNDPLYKDLGESYDDIIVAPGIALLREMFMRTGTNNIRQTFCLPDQTPVYYIEERGVFADIIFSVNGINRGVTSFIGDAAEGLWNLGVGTVNLAVDLSAGAVADLLRDQFGQDSVPAWIPTFQDGLDTIEGGLDIAQMIIRDPLLIVEGILDPALTAWTEGRHAESITRGVLDFGSLFAGGSGAVIGAARISRLAGALIIIKRSNLEDIAVFNRKLDETIDQFDGDIDSLREAAREAGLLDDVDARLALRVCSFAGDTLVLTDSGYLQIKDISAGVDRVWAKNEYTGHMGWQNVLAHYSNQYEETVHVTVVDDEGDRQTIRSNRIHPYFARLAAGAILASASAAMSPAIATEGHIYKGDIDGGAWVDAQHLKVGDELLGDDGQWLTVGSVEIEDQPLEAWNMSVDEYATYFVAGDVDATAVWVHNNCPGLSGEAATAALSNISRVAHASRHLIDSGVITASPNSRAAREAFQAIGRNILTNPTRTFDHVMTRGGQAVKGYYGQVDGVDVIIYIAKEPRGAIMVGDIVTSIVPTAQQMLNLGL